MAQRPIPPVRPVWCHPSHPFGWDPYLSGTYFGARLRPSSASPGLQAPLFQEADEDSGFPSGFASLETENLIHRALRRAGRSKFSDLSFVRAARPPAQGLCRRSRSELLRPPRHGLRSGPLPRQSAAAGCGGGGKSLDPFPRHPQARLHHRHAAQRQFLSAQAAVARSGQYRAALLAAALSLSVANPSSAAGPAQDREWRFSSGCFSA